MRCTSALLTLLLIFASVNAAAAVLIKEANEIPYQIVKNNR